MQRSFQKRAVLNHTQQPDQTQQPGQTQTRPDQTQQFPGQSNTIPSNFCPIPPKKSSSLPEPNMTEAEYLTMQYRDLIGKVRETRGKLYRLGIDPEKLIS